MQRVKNNAAKVICSPLCLCKNKWKLFHTMLIKNFLFSGPNFLFFRTGAPYAVRPSFFHFVGLVVSGRPVLFSQLATRQPSLQNFWNVVRFWYAVPQWAHVAPVATGAALTLYNGVSAVKLADILRSMAGLAGSPVTACMAFCGSSWASRSAAVSAYCLKRK